jgi:hypothetical protein
MFEWSWSDNSVGDSKDTSLASTPSNSLLVMVDSLQVEGMVGLRTVFVSHIAYAWRLWWTDMWISLWDFHQEDITAPSYSLRLGGPKVPLLANSHWSRLNLSLGKHLLHRILSDQQILVLVNHHQYSHRVEGTNTYFFQRRRFKRRFKIWHRFSWIYRRTIHKLLAKSTLWRSRCKFSLCISSKWLMHYHRIAYVP